MKIVQMNKRRKIHSDDNSKKKKKKATFILKKTKNSDSDRQTDNENLGNGQIDR